ncbi:hypothetical protein PR202_gb21051 [Eleusine coracana subsp. coracana]|uniref:F-box domain-containing protein n=1 Tax=Eleusine coracana subsp. coracana TaxID=191504 RepID=A0AAV5FC27_ELECO|nr:hypothetical protein PR202_gb21051 [Eleusine coracana subsp. coracana]
MEPVDGGGCKKAKLPAAPAVEATGDDVLGDIFLLLPDTASLARAALTCKRWRRVASDPALLRRFHSLHGPPLLGFVMLGPPPRPREIGYRGPDHRFLPATSSRNPHIAAAAAATDAHIEDFAARNPRSGALINRWVLRGSDGGRFLLTYGDLHRQELAVYDPIARTAEHFRCPGEIEFDFWDVYRVHYALVADDTDASFRVFAAQFSGCMKGAVFSSRTGEWTALPHLAARAGPWWSMRNGTRAGRFAYWKSDTNLKRYCSVEVEEIVVLDTTTMEWTLIVAPFPAKESYCVADIAEHGGLCIVSSKEQCLQIWARGTDGWVIKRQIFLLKEFAVLKRLRRDEWMKRVRVLEVRDGHVYLEFWSIRMPHSYFLVLNWQTMNLRVLANDADEKHRGPVFPFFMTWAPPLLSPAEASSSRYLTKEPVAFQVNLRLVAFDKRIAANG